MTTPQPLLTINDLSAHLQIPVGTIRDWRQRKYGPTPFKVGGQLRWRQVDVDRWLGTVAEKPALRTSRRREQP